MYGIYDAYLNITNAYYELQKKVCINSLQLLIKSVKIRKVIRMTEISPNCIPKPLGIVISTRGEMSRGCLEKS